MKHKHGWRLWCLINVDTYRSLWNQKSADEICQELFPHSATKAKSFQKWSKQRCQKIKWVKKWQTGADRTGVQPTDNQLTRLLASTAGVCYSINDVSVTPIWISIFPLFLRAHDPVCCQLFHYWPPLPTSASVTPLVWNQLQIHIFSLNFFISPKIDFRIQRHTYNGEMWIVRDPFGALADLLCGVIQRRLHFFL